ncbi:helix-turn-helix domain-containing protein [Francisella tularensis subsp. mediasiatica]|nr:helix-turn-helix domain-containing protein [Francisella tularensis subsp. mediasiatica]MBK2102201.1 helix-turn-helix domain-containing protein [Francisella tularensis subsp. mediasiatica]MBK2104761.1 helix-turn-helix domain-containing protein [Francisella tularensis subsp. mediasiatica]NVG86235.1 helix-turn-helix domain-containing protein [Francisella tularensis]
MELKQQGALDRKNASKYIANALNIGRATVYNYLK